MDYANIFIIVNLIKNWKEDKKYKMFGISGTALGAILRAKGKSYKEISIVSVVYAIIVLLISVVLLILGTATISGLIVWIPESVAAGITVTGLSLAFVGAILAGITAFVSMILGAAIMDAAEAIIRGVR